MDKNSEFVLNNLHLLSSSALYKAARDRQREERKSGKKPPGYRAKPLPKSKVCRNCTKEKHLRAFPKGSPTKRWPEGQPTQWCNKCHLEKVTRRAARTEEECVEHRAAKKANNLKNKLEEYGLLPSDIPKRCKVCKETSYKTLCIDHDHVTGIFRGFLCNSCNSALGFAKDNPKILKRLAKYLRDHAKETGKHE